MSILIADTSGLIAALDDTHPDQSRAQAALQAAGLLIISPLVLAEFDHLATRELGRRAAVSAIDDIAGWARRDRVRIPEITDQILAAAQSVRRSYDSLDLDLTDAVHVKLTAEYQTNEILTLEYRDFRAIRPLSSHDHFRVLPQDL